MCKLLTLLYTYHQTLQCTHQSPVEIVSLMCSTLHMKSCWHPLAAGFQVHREAAARCVMLQAWTSGWYACNWCAHETLVCRARSFWLETTVLGTLCWWLWPWGFSSMPAGGFGRASLGRAQMMPSVLSRTSSDTASVPSYRYAAAECHVCTWFNIVTPLLRYHDLQACGMVHTC